MMSLGKASGQSGTREGSTWEDKGEGRHAHKHDTVGHKHKHDSVGHKHKHDTVGHKHITAHNTMMYREWS